MKAVGSLLLLLSMVLLSACQTQPEMKQMQSQNQQLKADLESAKNNIASLKIQESELRQELTEKTRVMNVLGTEKSSRVQESSELRSQVRRFVQHQIDAYKDFLVQGDLLDYVGGELVERSNVEPKSLFVVDLFNQIPQAGTLTGVGGYFVRPGNFSVKVLRKIDQNLVVIWDSKSLSVKQAGLNRINFPVSVGVEQGDVIGYYFADGIAVSFDEGTGDARYQTDDLTLGASVRINSLQGEKRRRAYSLGVFGLLN